MTTETTTVATETAAPASSNGKAAKVKKAAAKVKAVPAKASPPKPKKAIKQAADGSLRGVAKPANWKPERTMRGFDPAAPIAHDNRLKAPQIRVLQLLARARAPLARGKIAESTAIDPSWVGVWVGRTDPVKRAESEAKWGYTSLLTLKFAVQKTVTVDDRDTVAYEITAAGRKSLEKHLAAEKAEEATKKDAEKAKVAKAKEKAKKAASKE